jgi:long-chain fatty acid transport protein
MKKTKIALAVAAATMLSTPAFATNGDALIGLGAQSRALGGTGTAAFFGSENALTNPALLAKSQGSEFAIGGTLFKPDVSAKSNVAGVAASETSDADTNIIPEVSMSTRINENMTFGLGMYGSAGMGVDYRGNAALFDAYSNLQLMKFVPTLAYNNSNFGLGFAPVLQYGALDLNYTDPTGATVGNGVSTDLGWGYNIGAYFDVTNELTVAASYQSAIDMEYKDQITVAADGFGIGPNGMQTITSDNLEQPAEIKVGVAYTMNNWMVTADAKQIKWGDAKGYKDFNWDDQNVYGIGAKYSGNGFWVGAGFNRGDDPIDVLPNATQPTTFSNQAVNLFNNHFFPAVVESHYTIGGGYQLSKNMTIEGAIVMAAEVDKTIDTGGISDAFDGGIDGSVPANGTTHEVTHSQIGYTVSLRMNF